jgi:hypothetical protein
MSREGEEPKMGAGGKLRRRGKGCRQRESRSRRLPRETREHVRWRSLKGEGPRVVAGEEQMRRVASDAGGESCRVSGSDFRRGMRSPSP